MTHRSMIAVLLSSSAVMACSGEARAQPDLFRYRQKSQGAYASLSGFVRDGLRYQVSVFFQESVEAVFPEGGSTGGGPPVGEVLVGIGIYHAAEDPDWASPLFAGVHSGPLDRNDYQFRGMNSASLEVTVPITSPLTGLPAGDATVVLDLAGGGPIDRQLVTTIEEYFGVFYKLHGDRQVRTMIPTGTVTFGDEVIPLDEASSEMTSIKNSVLQIVRP